MILLFAGSNNPQSINQTLIGWVAGLMKPETAQTIRLTNYELPIYSIIEENNGRGTSLTDLNATLAATDTLVIAVPEHNGSLSAFLKNILDWLSRQQADYRIFQGKKVHLLSASPGKGGQGAIRHTTDILERLGATIVQSLAVTDFYQKIQKNNGQLLPDKATQQVLITFIQNI